MTWTTDPAEFVHQAFLGLLGREPDAEGVRHHVAALERGARPAEILREIIDGVEFRKLRSGIDRNSYSDADDPRIARFRTQEVEATTRKITTMGRVPRADYDALWEATFGVEGVPPDQRGYAELHRERFWQLVSALSVITEGQESPRILEFGVSVFSHFYCALGPSVQYFAADRPLDDAHMAFMRQVCQTARASGYFTTDLNDPKFLTDELREEMGQFDVIVFTEVLEHLMIHPVDVLSPIMTLLAPGGTLYLSTPNFFSRPHLQQIERRENPQEVYPRAERGNADFHYHYREFCMAELFEFIAASGGRPTAFCFSSCWESEPSPVADEAGNLVVTAQRI